MAFTIEIDVWQGEIAELEVDAIIVPASESLFMTAPAARAVKLRAGDSVERAAVDQGPVEAGTAIVTPGGALAAPYVIHAVGTGHDLQRDPERLSSALESALTLSEHLGLGRLAMVPIGTERGVFTSEEAAGITAAALSARAASGGWLPSTLVVAVSSPAEAAAYRAAMEPIRSTAR
jgi:O-acetyl-ADP-ribose deacetylase (regulator of RNase III)